MKRMMTLSLIAFLFVFTPITPANAVGSTILERTIKSATTLIVPTENASVSYDAEKEHISISFSTGPDYREGAIDLYRRWRINQWAVLQEFKLSKIPVKMISVETNRTEDGTLVRYTHSKRHSDKYGDIHSNKLWLRTGRVMEKSPNSETWQKIK